MEVVYGDGKSASSWLDLKWGIEKSNLLFACLHFVLEIDVAKIGISERPFLNTNLWGCGVMNKIFQVYILDIKC